MAPYAIGLKHTLPLRLLIGERNDLGRIGGVGNRVEGVAQRIFQLCRAFRPAAGKRHEPAGQGNGRPCTRGYFPAPRPAPLISAALALEARAGGAFADWRSVIR